MTAADYKSTVLGLGADRLWMLDETSGTTAVDSASGSHGTIHNTPGFTAGGPLDHYTDFDGTSQYVSASSWAIGPKYSAHAWVNCGPDQRIGQIVGAWGNDRAHHSWILATTDYTFEAFTYTTLTGYKGLDFTVDIENCWHLIGVSWDPTGLTRLYLDGQPVASASARPAPPAPTVDIEIARKESGLRGEYFKGGICGVAVYNNTALSDSDHAAIFAAAPWNCRHGFRHVGLVRGARG